MERKEAHNTTTPITTPTTTTYPLGMCERLFNALNTNNTFRPLRRLTTRQQDPEPQSATPSNNFPATAVTDAKHKTPSPPRSIAAPYVAKNDVKATDQNAIPTPIRPKGAIVPLPAPPAGAVSTDTANTKPVKTINQKVEDYIYRTKGKLRTGSTVGRTQTSK
ncbi:vegetative cell wall protein gp1-like protein [Carex littledalei]|uniref:Vegetative cell wall protein gp1-like protein n=1 Tax=Carex littledalei TaxID=544730 RepID=A0A833QWP1_9POAL|nr:vegetative cell wall protein gp1-like protein [Carex littledalei]